MAKTIDLLALGSACVDINCTHFPFGEEGLLPETEVVGEQYEVVPGGAALNFVRFCASLGLHTAFVGKVGQDKMAALLTELMKESGVRPEFIIDPEAATNVGLNFVNPAGKSIMGVAGNAKFRMTPEEVEAKITSLLPETGFLMLGGVFKLKMMLPALQHVAAAAKATNTKLVIDHGRLPQGTTSEEKAFLHGLVEQADYYFPSRDEFQQLWSVSSIEEGLRFVAEKSNAITVVKDSTNGALTLIDGQIIRIPAFPVEAINTIGAGDSFNAGFITAQKEGMSIKDSMRFACAVAALKVSRRELPTREAAAELLASHTDI